MFIRIVIRGRCRLSKNNGTDIKEYATINRVKDAADSFCGNSLCGQSTLKKEIPGQKTLGSIQNNPVRVDVLFCRGVRCISL